MASAAQAGDDVSCVYCAVSAGEDADQVRLLIEEYAQGSQERREFAGGELEEELRALGVGTEDSEAEEEEEEQEERAGGVPAPTRTWWQFWWQFWWRLWWQFWWQCAWRLLACLWAPLRIMRGLFLTRAHSRVPVARASCQPPKGERQRPRSQNHSAHSSTNARQSITSCLSLKKEQGQGQL
jgi:hypothetical protein